MSVSSSDVVDHLTEALGLLLQQYQNKPRLSALIASYVNRVQELETWLLQTFTLRFIDFAQNSQLDTLGKIVGQARKGATDAVYRLYILARIRANISKGQARDIEQIAMLVLGPLRFLFWDVYPASFFVDVLDPLTANADFLADIIKHAARAAGVGSSLHWSTDPEGETFAFSDNPIGVQTLDTVRGFADSGATVGGKLIGAF